MSDDAVKTAIDELYKCLSIDSIIGEPIEIGDKIIIPVTKMSFVFGMELNGSRKNCTECMSGGGGTTPVAVVIISKGIKGPDGIRIIPLNMPSAQFMLADSLINMVSAALSRLNTGSTAGRK